MSDAASRQCSFCTCPATTTLPACFPALGRLVVCEHHADAYVALPALHTTEALAQAMYAAMVAARGSFQGAAWASIDPQQRAGWVGVAHFIQTGVVADEDIFRRHAPPAALGELVSSLNAPITSRKPPRTYGGALIEARALVEGWRIVEYRPETGTLYARGHLTVHLGPDRQRLIISAWCDSWGGPDWPHDLESAAALQCFPGPWKEVNTSIGLKLRVFVADPLG